MGSWKTLQFSLYDQCADCQILLSDSQRQGFDVEIAQIAVIFTVLIWVLDYSGCWCNVPILKNIRFISQWVSDDIPY